MQTNSLPPVVSLKYIRGSRHYEASAALEYQRTWYTLMLSDKQLRTAAWYGDQYPCAPLQWLDPSINDNSKMKRHVFIPAGTLTSSY